ncbi:hypothetical protein GW17_00010240, partial [Ensete ventricosum]
TTPRENEATPRSPVRGEEAAPHSPPRGEEAMPRLSFPTQERGNAGQGVASSRVGVRRRLALFVPCGEGGVASSRAGMGRCLTSFVPRGVASHRETSDLTVPPGSGRSRTGIRSDRGKISYRVVRTEEEGEKYLALIALPRFPCAVPYPRVKNRSCDPLPVGDSSPAGDSFSPRGEKERGDCLLLFDASAAVCEHAYSLAQNLDPNSEGRGVLQFKTGLMSVIKIFYTHCLIYTAYVRCQQKLAKRDGGGIDRSQDIAYLQEFYKRYREKHKVDELREDEMKLRESGVFSGNLGEYVFKVTLLLRLEKKTVKRKKVFATLRVLGSVLEDLTREIAPDDAAKIISEEVYIVKAAISSLKCYTDLPKLPSDFPVPAARGADVLDLLQYVFGFQVGFSFVKLYRATYIKIG